ncbi:MAG TPA: hypothetical protein VK034_31005, partial [Enhygromyxa sp.]|nr:hypothetical protein [Enhygromyxa sp.]
PPTAIPAEDGPKTNITGLGWCRDESVCAVGAQPFCTCSVDAASNYVCATGGDYNRQVPATQPCLTSSSGTCFCVPVEITCTNPVTP